MASAEDKARKARNYANKGTLGVSYAKSTEIAKKNAKAAGKKLTMSETEKAADTIQARRNTDAQKTARRATFIASESSPASKREAAARMVAGITGSGGKNVKPLYK